MISSDPGCGAGITLRSGRRRIYDAVECMAAAVLTDSVAQRDIRETWLVDHDAPRARLPLGRVVFLECGAIDSPMGLSLLSFSSRERAGPPRRARRGVPRVRRQSGGGAPASRSSVVGCAVLRSRRLPHACEAAHA